MLKIQEVKEPEKESKKKFPWQEYGKNKTSTVSFKDTLGLKTFLLFDSIKH